MEETLIRGTYYLEIHHLFLKKIYYDILYDKHNFEPGKMI